jgi:hypothetical protein
MLRRSTPTAWCCEGRERRRGCFFIAETQRSGGRGEDKEEIPLKVLSAAKSDTRRTTPDVGLRNRK